MDNKLQKLLDKVDSMINDVKTRTETKAKTDVKAKTETRTKTDAKTKTETRTKTEPKLQVEAKLDNTKTETKAKTETKTETKAKTDTKAKTETKTDTKLQVSKLLHKDTIKIANSITESDQPYAYVFGFGSYDNIWNLYRHLVCPNCFDVVVSYNVSLQVYKRQYSCIHATKYVDKVLIRDLNKYSPYDKIQNKIYHSVFDNKKDTYFINCECGAKFILLESYAEQIESHEFLYIDSKKYSRDVKKILRLLLDPIHKLHYLTTLYSGEEIISRIKYFKIPMAKIVRYIPRILTRFRLYANDIDYLRDYLYEKGLVDIINEYLIVDDDTVKKMISLRRNRKSPDYNTFINFMKTYNIYYGTKHRNNNSCKCKWYCKMLMREQKEMLYTKGEEKDLKSLYKKFTPNKSNNYKHYKDCPYSRYNKWILSLPVNSYDLNTPIISYPRGYDAEVLNRYEYILYYDPYKKKDIELVYGC